MTTINGLPPVTTPAATDLIPTQQAGGATVSQTPAQILSTQRNVANGVAGLDSTNTITGQSVTVGSTTQPIGTWLTGNIAPGGLFPPFSNYSGSGFPCINIPGVSRLILDGGAGQTAAQYTLLNVVKTATSTTGSGLNTALNISTKVGATNPGQEWNALFNISTSGTSNGVAVGSYSQATKNATATDAVWGSISQVIDNTDLASSANGGKGVLGMEVDVSANKADDATNSLTYGGTGTRKGVQFVLYRANTTDNTAVGFSSGVWITNSNDAYTYLGQGFGFSVGTQAYSAFDSRGVAVPTGSSNPVIAVNMAAGHVIDFAGGSLLTSAPQRYLSYSTTDTALEYKNASGTVLAAVSDTGNLSTTGLVIPATNGSTPTSGATVTIPNNVQKYFIRGTATLASLTIDLPVTPVNGQDLTLIFEVGVTSLTITPPSGYTVNVPVSGAAVGAGSRIALTLDSTLWC